VLIDPGLSSRINMLKELKNVWPGGRAKNA
jgi:hypothetical protein